MDWRESVSEGFPRRNRDEPPSLRRDIADELGDHLACAFARELERTGDESAARRAVLDRFGDPKKLARRLWLDAMREVIMNQRILLATCIILAAACLATATFSWIAMNNSRQANEVLLSEVKGLSQQAKHNSPWAYLNVRVLRGSDTGPPVEGIEVSLEGKTYNETERSLMRKADADGRCAFGPIRPGLYTIYVGSQFADQTFSFYSRTHIDLLPGDKDKVIHYPDIPRTKVGFAIDLPPDLQGEDLVFGCQFEFQDFRDWKNKRDWKINKDVAFDARRPYYEQSEVYFDRSGELLELQGYTSTSTIFRKAEPPQRFALWPALSANLVNAKAVSIVGRQNGFLFTKRAGFFQCTRQPEYTVKADKENVWQIKLPEDLIAETRFYLHWQIRLGEKAAGRLVYTRRVVKDCMVLKYLPQWSNGNVDNIGVANNNGGVRTLLKWNDLPKGEVYHEVRRFFLALYSRRTTVGTTEPISLLAHEITEEWPELTSWETMPEFADEPAARFDFEPGIGWKLFDVTEFVRDQARSNRPNHGLLLRFEREDVTIQETGLESMEVRLAGAADHRATDSLSLSQQGGSAVHDRQWSGYNFVSREGKKYNRPVLLVVEPES